MSTRKHVRRLLAPLILLAAATLPVPGTDAYENQLLVDFEESDWWDQFEQTGDEPERANRIPGLTNDFLRIDIPPSSHEGAQWWFDTGEAEDVTIRYDIRWSQSWDWVYTGGGKLPGFGHIAVDANGNRTCAEGGCGGFSVGDGPYYSARGSFFNDNRPMTYTYTPGCDGAASEFQEMRIWDVEPMEVGEWYEIRHRIKMNTPGESDGLVQGWVNNVKVFEYDDFCFRTAENSDVPVGTAWFHFRYGGAAASPPTTWLSIDIDDVYIAW